MAMAVNVAPHAAGAVEIGAAIDVVQPAAVGALDQQRLVLGHLRERVPVVAAVPIEKLLAGWLLVHERVGGIRAKPPLGRELGAERQANWAPDGQANRQKD